MNIFILQNIKLFIVTNIYPTKPDHAWFKDQQKLPVHKKSFLSIVSTPI